VRAARPRCELGAKGICLDFYRWRVYPKVGRAAVFFSRARFFSFPAPVINQTMQPQRLFNVAAAAGAILALTVAASACRRATRSPTSATAHQPARPASPYEPTNAIPHDLFPDMPIYSGARVQHVFRPKGSMRRITFEVKAPFDALVNFYKEQLKKGGFRVNSSLIMRARRAWTCDFNKDGRPGTVAMYPSDDKTAMIVDLIYALPSKEDDEMREALEKFDVVGPGPFAQRAPNPNEKTKRN
jgi:hypothetical protein